MHIMNRMKIIYFIFADAALTLLYFFGWILYRIVRFPGKQLAKIYHY